MKMSKLVLAALMTAAVHADDHCSEFLKVKNECNPDDCSDPNVTVPITDPPEGKCCEEHRIFTNPQGQKLCCNKEIFWICLFLI